MSTVVITGTSRGIGMATALVLARAGYTVHAGMRNPAASPELSSIASEENLPLHVHMMDVDSDSSVADAFARILFKGPVDVLVNNAGVEQTGSIEEAPLSRFRACMETNCFGALRCTQAVVRHMRERGSGVIINITSVAGRISSAPLTPYSASKFALEAVSEGLAQEMKPFGVRVAVVQPGIIDTRMARNIEGMGNSNLYPHAKRYAALFAASLSQASTPALVGEKIREIIESPTGALHYPVGPDAAPFLAWRASMTDEQWLNWNSQSDADWLKAIEKDFGMKLTLA